jgi:transposase
MVFMHYRHDRISLISGLSVSPRKHHIGLYYQLYAENLRREHVCDFLQDLLKHLPAPLVVVWDNGPIHKGPAIRDFLAQHARIHVEYFPAYAPELNPDEGVWTQTKGALANGRPDDLSELRQDLSLELWQLSNSQESLRACFHESELPPFIKH